MKLPDLLGPALIEMIAQCFGKAAELGEAPTLAGDIVRACPPEARVFIEPFISLLAEIPPGACVIQIGGEVASLDTPADAIAFVLAHYEPCVGAKVLRTDG